VRSVSTCIYRDNVAAKAGARIFLLWCTSRRQVAVASKWSHIERVGPGGGVPDVEVASHRIFVRTSWWEEDMSDLRLSWRWRFVFIMCSLVQHFMSAYMLRKPLFAIWRATLGGLCPTFRRIVFHSTSRVWMLQKSTFLGHLDSWGWRNYKLSKRLAPLSQIHSVVSVNHATVKTSKTPNVVRS
jgi:hypothetical protein